MKITTLLLTFCSIICANLGYFISNSSWVHGLANIVVEICLILAIYYIK